MLHVGHVSIYSVCRIRELKALPMTQSATADSCYELRFEPHPFNSRPMMLWPLGSVEACVEGAELTGPDRVRDRVMVDWRCSLSVSNNSRIMGCLGYFIPFVS